MLALLCAAVVTTIGLTPDAARAETVGRGTAGQRLTVSKTTGINRQGETLSVSGTGYDTNKGIYVAFCVDNGAGSAPSPCGGGIDMSGDSGASQWISSNPPAYGEGLAIPYGPGGSFSVQVKVSSRIGDVDCTVRRCAVVTRTDHLRTADRSQDVRVPVTFAAAQPASADPTAPAANPTNPGPGRTAAAPVSPATASPSAAGVAATASAADPGAGAPTAAATAAAEVTRVSQSTAADRWWNAALIALAGVVALLLVLRFRRRRGAR
ncbi:hypothetical protein GCM10009779_35650 [Polymorphospora rubra]|uniref:MYXO-CTERM domain-containing protein n=1 Tax=Polymorphospora rubra TaxID=338584 RepID=A0A810N8V9_9ACTN|nr:hypothetical protein Prubr_73020 [Polymorphospora rubra]